LSGTTRVSQYQKKHSPTHTYRGHQSSLICLIYLIWFMASSLFNLRTRQSFPFPKSLSKLSLVYLLAWHPPFHTPYISSPNHCLLFTASFQVFCCSTEIMSSNPSLSLNSLLGTLSCSFTQHIHLTILISALWSATSFSFLMGQVSLPCNILLHTQLLYNVPLTINDIPLVRNFGTVLWHCCLGSRKIIRPVKTEWWGTGMVICLEWSVNGLYMVQLMPLPLHHLLLQ